MHPDFDYEMEPTELKPVLSYAEERGATRLGTGGLATAAHRIASVPRATSNGNGTALAERRPAAKVVAKVVKSSARPSASVRPGGSVRPKKQSLSGAKKHKPAKTKGRK
jgi:hypothetical protein